MILLHFFTPCPLKGEIVVNLFWLKFEAILPLRSPKLREGVMIANKLLNRAWYLIVKNFIADGLKGNLFMNGWYQYRDVVSASAIRNHADWNIIQRIENL